MSKHVREKCRKVCISSILSPNTSTNIDANWRHSNLICSTVIQSHMQNFSSIMSKHVREKWGQLCISSILSSKRGITPTKMTQIDDTWTRSVVQQNKVICKISAQFVMAFRRKLRKTVYFQYFKFQKGHNSYKNWRKLTKLQLDQMFIWKKVTCKISARGVKSCRRKMWKRLTDRYPDGRTDGWTDEGNDGHHHTIIRPVWRRAYKNRIISSYI